MCRARNLGWCLLLAAVLLLIRTTACAAPPVENTLAILNLRPTNFEAMGYNGEILYALISALEKEKSVKLVPRRQMEDKLFQAGLVQGDSPDMAMAAARALGIRYVLFGNVTKDGQQILANMNLMDAQCRRVAESWTEAYGSRQDILAKIPQFAAALAAALVRAGSDQGGAELVQATPIAPKVTLETLGAAGEGDKVVVRWKISATEAIAGYQLYRSESPEGPYQFLGRSQEAEFVDKAIRKGRTYYYRIGVVLVSGREITIDRTAEIRNAGEKLPHPPLILGAAGFVRRTEVKYVPNLLNDQEKFSIVEYRIHRKAGHSDPWTAIATTGAKLSSQQELGFTFEETANLEDGSTYFYAISSVDRKKRESPLSDPVSVSTVSRPQLRLEKDHQLRKIDLAWQLIDQAEGYYLYRKQAAESWQRVEKVRAQPSFPYTDEDGLEDGQQYEYRITAYDAKGETGPSNVVTAKTKALPPHPADIVARSGMVKSVALAWTPVDDPDVGGYAIYRGAAPDRLEALTKLKGYRKNSYQDKGVGFSSLADGTDYHYAVASYNLFGAEGQKTPAVRARTKPRPSAAAGLRLSALPDRILVQWDLNSEPDIDTYRLYRSRGGGGWSKIAEIGPREFSYSDTDLKPDTEYRYRMIVEDSDGLEGDPAESRPIQSPVAASKK
ncbi:MAG: hypothetical protein K9L59_04305 [Desulfobacterales bacterium]|nr:hypothetical protein [Desulfobacterales bacterium]